MSAHLARILEPLRVTLPAVGVATYEVIVDRSPHGPFELWLDDERLVSSDRPTRPYAHLLQAINRHANRRTAPSATLLHSAAAVSSRGPVLLPATMESGKSTLVTALVRDGWAYLTDELVAIDPQAGTLRAFPRSISLDRGSWHLFPDLEPDVAPTLRRLLPAQWQLPPESIGRIAEDGVLPAAIVTHRYAPSAVTELVELDPIECLRRLIPCCFSFDEHAERDLEVLARTIDRTSCHELTVGELTSARDVLGSAFGAPVDQCTSAR